jgi:hypothetical protein
MAIWNSLRTFGIFNDLLLHFVYSFDAFFQFWYQVPGKIWQPWYKQQKMSFGYLHDECAKVQRRRSSMYPDSTFMVNLKQNFFAFETRVARWINGRMLND